MINKKNIEELARKISEAILADVTDRRGWRQEWDQFDSDARRDIKRTHRRIIASAIKKALAGMEIKESANER